MSTVWCGSIYKDEVPKLEKYFFGAEHIHGEKVHPIDGQDPNACVTVGAGLWKDKIYHFLPDMPPSSAGEEVHTEFFVEHTNFREAMEALFEIRHVFAHLV